MLNEEVTKQTLPEEVDLEKEIDIIVEKEPEQEIEDLE